MIKPLTVEERAAIRAHCEAILKLPSFVEWGDAMSAADMGLTLLDEVERLTAENAALRASVSLADVVEKFALRGTL